MGRGRRPRGDSCFCGRRDAQAGWTGNYQDRIHVAAHGRCCLFGEGAKAATEMAKADFGPTKFNYQFIYEDDQFKPEEAANTANKLIDVDKVNAIVSFGSPTGNVVSPIAEENDVIHFGIASDLTIAKGDYNFIDWTPPYKETDLLVSEFEKGASRRSLCLKRTSLAFSR